MLHSETVIVCKCWKIFPHFWMFYVYLTYVYTYSDLAVIHANSCHSFGQCYYFGLFTVCRGVIKLLYSKQDNLCSQACKTSYNPNRSPTAQVLGLPNFWEWGSVLSAKNFVSPLATLWSFIEVVHECNIYRVLWVYNSVCVCVCVCVCVSL